MSIESQLEQEPIRDVPVPAPPPAADPDLSAPELFLNRELSWLDFNDRVLQLAEDPAQPLMERVKFVAIFASNLDEFFMIRVAGLHDQVDAGLTKPKFDGRTPRQILDEVREKTLPLVERQIRVWDDVLRPALADEGISIIALDDVGPECRRDLQERFERQILPVLTPLAVGLGRPFPYISNLSLSLAVLVRDPEDGTETFARVKVPKEVLPRFVQAGSPTTFVALEDLIAANLDALFPGMQVVKHGAFRVTRDADFEISDEADDLLRAVEQELRRRRFGEVVRLELGRGFDPELREQLESALGVEPDQVYEVDGGLDLQDLMDLVKLPGHEALRDPRWKPVTQPRLAGSGRKGADMFREIRRRDVLVHHPYDSFSTSVERFVEQAADDPDVLAIKLTIYRTSDDTPLVPALMRASEKGKQCVGLVELKARFDERANIEWARKLEETGVHVVYGLPSLKTHTKCVLVVRREGEGVRRYVHVGTGNYHPDTARLYTDFGLFTDDEALAADVADMFNLLTGFARPRGYRKALVAPEHLRDGILREIDLTIEAAGRGEPARIRMKMNSLVDLRCMQALMRASRAGVPVDLNIRGICCMLPGVPGVSEHVRVVSVVGRFLEHSRIFAFERGEETRVLIGSADLMPRNLDTRVELVAPVEDEAARADVLDSLDRAFTDDAFAWELRSDGTWERVQARGAESRSMHRDLMASHAARAAEPPEE
jgi:polyphosphate kinase